VVAREEPTVEPLVVTAIPTPTAAAASGSAGATLASADLVLDEATTKRLDAILRNQVRNKGVVGLQAAVRLPTGEIWTGSAGNAELTPDRPVTDDTQFAIASVTKTFVAALILQLAEEGKIDLDEPIATYFDDVPRGKKATVRQLLSHTSGIYNYFESPRYQAAARAWWESPDATGLNARDHRWTYDEIMGLVRASYFKPGRDYRYSNTNYVILGQIAEAVEGEPIHRQLRTRFFKPLGLEDTIYQPDQKPGAGAAHGHWNYAGYTDHTREADVIPFMAAISVADAAGAMASTASDLALWAEMLYGGKVLSEDSLEQMTTFLRQGSYGLGTDVATFAGKRAHGHRGGLRGFESSMWHFPGTGVTIVLLSNQGNWNTDDPMKRLAKAVFGSG
jgi:D-alanyl-D-alanine carboxypeptidase